MLLNVSKPGCFYIQFANGNPRYFEIRDEQGRIYYFRHLSNVPRIKFNVIHTGRYNSNVDFNLVKVDPVEIPSVFPELPPPERDRWKDTEIVFNPNLYDSPVRIFTQEGIIEAGPDFYGYPPPIKMFLILHEEGHMFYYTEKHCDLWALVNYLRMGYNRSMAFYALTKILSRNPTNTIRIMELFNQIQKTQKNKL